jgi:SAM-dependent methyltransferase
VAVAVEPSARAVLDGKENFPEVSFVRGTASALPLRQTFDLVIVNFVFHWIDRQNLLEVVAEADRLVADCGFLIIGDFYPANQLQVRYHHLQDQEIYTYKQNYAAIFLASGMYHPVALLTAHHADKRLNAEVAESDRIGAWLLRKGMRSHYLLSGINGKHG